MDGIFKRIALIFKIFILIAVAVIMKIVYVQFINPTEVSASDIAYREEVIEATRGDILSSDGRPLATSVPYYEIRMDCLAPNKDTFEKYVDALSRELSEFFGNKSAARYKSQLLKARRDTLRYERIGNRLVDYSELEQIKQFPILRLGANRGGLIVNQKNRRNNPYGRLAYRTIGFINTQGVGVGIEGTCDYYLKGTPGRQIVQRVLGGEWIPVNGAESVEPKDGYDIQTTLDIEIQEVAENALRKQLLKDADIEGATALVMEVETGAVRAIVNMKKDGRGGFDESYNYAIGSASEPGSVFKLVSLVCMLEDGYVTLDTPVNTENGMWRHAGHVYTDTHPIGTVTVAKALEQSSNVAFAKLIYEHYADNESAFVDRIQNMKVGERFNLDIQGEARAVIYSPEDKMWSNSTITSMAIGYAVLVTPLHLLTFYNAIANDGKMMKPYFIDSYRLNGETVKKFKPVEVSGAICSKNTARTARAALRGVVKNGTGRGTNSPNFEIAGKTGTSRISFGGKYGYQKNGYRRYQASFAGFFPADDPKYSAIVVLYSGQTKGNFYGATWALPAFREIAEYIYSTSPEWKRELDGSRAAAQDVPSFSKGRADEQRIILSELEIAGKKSAMPAVARGGGWVKITADSSLGLVAEKYEIESDSLADVTGMGLKDALYILENQGFKVKFNGYGRVAEQRPAPGSSIKRGATVNLILDSDETE